jgi:hypothetical protein
MEHDEFDIIVDKEKDLITIGTLEFTGDFFRNLMAWKMRKIRLIQWNVQCNPNFHQLGNYVYNTAKPELLIKLEASADQIEAIP